MGLITVVTPAVRRAMTTVERYRQSAPADDLLDAQVEMLIGQATARAESYCDRIFARERVIEAFWVDRKEIYLFLTRLPVTTIHTVTVQGSLLASDRYALEDTRSGVLKLFNAVDVANEAFYRALGSGDYGHTGSDSPFNQKAKIEVEYTGGWLMPDAAGADLPADLEQAIQLVVRDMVERKAAARLDIVSEKLGDASFTYAQQSSGGAGGTSSLPFDQLVAPILDRHRIVPL